MSEPDIEQTVSLLARTPATLDALLRDLPESWILSNEGENTMSPHSVVGHLAYCERGDWMPRVRMILESGETRVFEPLDRWGHASESQEKSIGQLLDEFAALRARNLKELSGMKLGPRQLELRGRHPALGTVTLSQLLATWAAHDMTHLHQISRVLAHQYRDAVGPWSRYLGVLSCNGHSAAA